MATTVVLTWNKNTEPDLAGYNVYRAIGSAPVKGITPKLNTGMVAISTPTYQDVLTGAAVDGDYWYAVSAVDTAGNESAFSASADKVINVVPPAAPTGLVLTIQ